MSELKVNKTVDTKLVLIGFKDYYSNLAVNLLEKLPKPQNKFKLNAVLLHYKCIIQSYSRLFIILNNNKVSKAASPDELSGRYLKDGAKFLA